MQKRTWKKIALGVLSVFTLLVIVLCVHIYIVTHQPMDPNLRAMARIDLKQSITKDDAGRITAWLYQQKGVDHVLVNPQSNIAVFTFFPAKTTANRVVSDFKASLPYKAERYLPNEAAMSGSCPVMGASTSYKIFSWLKNIF